MDEHFLWFVGIDASMADYQICLLDTAGKLICERTIPHTGSGIAQFLDWLAEHRPQPGRVAVAIETPRGAMIEALVERNYAVFAINPKQLDRFRDRYMMAGAKDDRRDAFVLADSVRTDQHCFKRVNIDHPLIVLIREFSRMEDDLQQDWSRLSNQLRQQLHRYYPQMLRLSGAADDPWVWDLIEMVPLPAQAVKLQRAGCKSCSRNIAFGVFPPMKSWPNLEPSRSCLLLARLMRPAKCVCY
jgi:hypothetical protein